MEFGYDPLKKTISQSIGDFFVNNLVNQGDKDWMNKILTGEKIDGRKKENHKASHSLLLNILKGLYDKGTIGSEDSVEIIPMVEEDQIATWDEPTPGGSGTQNPRTSTDPTHGDSTPSKSEVKNTNTPNMKFENGKLCKFYNKGKCTKGKKCNFEHPEICKAFRKFGLKKYNAKGCDGKCEFLHPNTCRDSLKNRSCPRQDCRFFHLKGTKVLQEAKGNQGYQGQFSQMNQFATQNRFSPLHDQSSKQNQSQAFQAPPAAQRDSNQVFHEDSPKLMDTLASILKQLAEMSQRQNVIEQRIQTTSNQGQSSQNIWSN